MASDRIETRRDHVLDKANSIGTTDIVTGFESDSGVGPGHTRTGRPEPVR
jgi:hypothetical protein